MKVLSKSVPPFKSYEQFFLRVGGFLIWFQITCFKNNYFIHWLAPILQTLLLHLGDKWCCLLFLIFAHFLLIIFLPRKKQYQTIPMAMYLHPFTKKCNQYFLDVNLCYLAHACVFFSSLFAWCTNLAATCADRNIM